MELYEEIKEDREAGARRLVNEYRSRLMGMAMGLTKSPHEAEDLVFRTFERVILKIDDYKPTGSFYYWVCTILVNFLRPFYNLCENRNFIRQDFCKTGMQCCFLFALCVTDV